MIPMDAPQPGVSTTPAWSKRRWRRFVLDAIAAMDADDRRAQEAAIVALFADLPGWSVARTVLLYAAGFPEEIETVPLLEIAYGSGKRVVLPRVDPIAGRLRLHPVGDPRSELLPGILGIPEPRPDLPEIDPEAIDWTLVPGLAFDQQGYRLGRGAGHYDRLLPTLRPDCSCWAIALSCQIVDGFPVEPHDIALDGLLTPDRRIRGVGRSTGQRPPAA